jgi:hypothetical protein
MAAPFARRAAPLLALALAGAGGCALDRPRSVPAPLRAAQVERLYFGRSIGDTAVVTDSAWAEFVRTVLTPAFPDGATTWEAVGQWRAPDGRSVHERSYVVELVYTRGRETDARVRLVIEAYKRQFAQQGVLRVVTAARTGS